MSAGGGAQRRTRLGHHAAVTKPGLTLLAILLDRSSAVRPVAGAIRSGVDALLFDQQERPGELLVTLATCAGSGQETGCAQLPVDEVGPVALRPRGRSALHEGIGTLIDDVGAELAGTDEAQRPERVVVAVVGDTAAETGGSDRIRELVERQRRDYAWEFVLVDVPGGARASTESTAGGRGAGEPARGHDDGGSDGAGARSDGATLVAPAEARLGIPATAALVAGPAPEGVRAGLEAASAFVSRARESRPWEPVEGFTDGERDAATVPARPSGWRRMLGAGG